MHSPPAQTPPRLPSFGDALEAWALIAAQSFGGPAGQIAVMYRIWVEERRWLSEERFLRALNVCMLLPGSETHELATYVGWLSHGYRGGIVAGALFVLPGFVSVLALSAAYVRLHQQPLVEAALLGIEAAALAVVADALLRIGRRVLVDPAAIATALAAFAALLLLAAPFPLVVLAAGAAGALLRRWFPPPAPPTPRERGHGAPVLDALADSGGLAHTAPAPRRDLAVGAALVAAWLAPAALLWAATGPGSVWTRAGALLSTAAASSLGGAHAVLAYVAQRAVERYGWLAPGELLDGLGLVGAAPGPLAHVMQFVTFLAAYREPGGLPPLVAGALGAALAAWTTFGPGFALALAGGPYFERIRASAALASAHRAVTAAAVGAIASLGAWLALHALFAAVDERTLYGVRLAVPDPATLRGSTLAIGIVAGVALIRLRLPLTPVLATSGLLGLMWGVLTR